MTPFIVLSPGRFVDPLGIEIAIQAFSDLFQSLSPKHQRKSRLIIIEEENEIEITEKLLDAQNLKKSAGIIRREDIDQVKIAYTSASLFLFPVEKYAVKIIPEALSFGLPVLTYENSDLKPILDKTCSMLVDNRLRNQSVELYTNFLEILYFDPEVRKILSRGAINKYENELNWGGRKVRASFST